MSENKKLFSNFKGDVTGGLTAAIVSLPGNIIFGIIAFSPLGGDYVSQGILASMFASVFGGILAAMFGGTPFMITGPQAAPAIVLASVLAKLAATIDISTAPGALKVMHIAFSCIFISGGLQLIFSFLRMGGIVKYVSYPVVVGVINGTAVLIILGQLGAVMGMPGVKAVDILFNLDKASFLAPVVSLVTILIMMYGGRISTILPPALLAIIGGTALYYLIPDLGPSFSAGPTIGSVANGVPDITHAIKIAKLFTDKSYFSTLHIVINGALALAVINSMDSLLSALMLQNLTNLRTDANKELLGQGLGNLVSPLFGGISTSGFIGRSVANFKSGGRTRLSSIIHSIVIFVVIGLFANYISYIPRSVMAAVIVLTGIRLFDPFSIGLFKDFVFKKTLGNHSVNLYIIGIVMAVVIFMDMTIALGVGVAISFMVFLSGMSKGVIHRVYSGDKFRSHKMREESLSNLLNSYGDRIVVLELDGTLFFAAAERLADFIDTLSTRKFIILDFKRIYRIDTTGYRILEQAYTRLRQKGVTLGFSYLYEGREIMTEFRNLGLDRVVDASHIFQDTDTALEYFEDHLIRTLNADTKNKKEYTVDMFLQSYGFSMKEVALIEPYLELKQYIAGESVFVQGDEGDSLFLIVDGLADVTLKLPGILRKKRIVTLTYGTIFGEMALLDGKPRSANVDVIETLTCYQLTVSSFDRLKNDIPDMAIKIITVISKILTQRLRDANNIISQLES